MFKKPILRTSGIKWLKSIHLILSVIWLGGAIGMNALRFAWTPRDPGDLYAVDHAIVLLDHWVMIPFSFGSLISGLLESWLTTWGFFKYRWVTVKWILTVMIMLHAPFFQAQWARQMEEISRVEGLLALQNAVYVQDRLLSTVSALAMISALLFMSIISTIKPWMKTDRLKISPSKKSNHKVDSISNSIDKP